MLLRMLMCTLMLCFAVAESSAGELTRKRDELWDYERNLRTWCRPASPERLDACIHHALRRQEGSPQRFADGVVPNETMLPAPVQRVLDGPIESTPLPLTTESREDRLRKREELRIYERDLQAWCAQSSPQRLEACMRDSLARHGLAPTFFTDMERALDTPTEEGPPPLPKQAAPPAPSSRPGAFGPPPFPPPPGHNERPPTARPGPVQEWPTSEEQMCAALGKAAQLITRARDGGEPLGSVLQRLRRQPLGDPMIEEWREEIGADIYASPWLTPERAQQAAEVKCLRQMKAHKP